MHAWLVVADYIHSNADANEKRSMLIVYGLYDQKFTTVNLTKDKGEI